MAAAFFLLQVSCRAATPEALDVGFSVSTRYVQLEHSVVPRLKHHDTVLKHALALRFVYLVLRPVIWVDHLAVYEELVSLDLEQHVFSDSKIRLIPSSSSSSFIFESYVWLVLEADLAVSKPQVESQLGS